jgi:hypothetical protein
LLANVRSLKNEVNTLSGSVARKLSAFSYTKSAIYFFPNVIGATQVETEFAVLSK